MDSAGLLGEESPLRSHRARVEYDGEPGIVEFVARREDPDAEWCVEEFGRGCMLLVSPFGRVFLADPESDYHLEFAGRDEPP